ncbi:transcription factor FapR [Domibacillus enclensis]|uniref:Transcription factor FapR n=1 Tax=Domibacillus enclensis TaxID=1017273 RepID=A0A1N6UFJ7_9BACI|nr:transcription factor FapR [Domibacillus enclensis]OXS78516.1 fatty acid biosynthesis transcriptional regulator [Domibacillus enclensis]SIQ64425.1 Acyl-coenzyme A thioesterase PaaI, contains HGG motif [Domibacillus enclensis]
MRKSKKERQERLQLTIQENPFVTDEELAQEFNVSVQTIRLDRMELSIPELRERIKYVAEKNMQDEVRSLPIEEVIGDIIDIELDSSAISLFDVKKEHVFTRNGIARGHHLFAQANSLAVAVINDEMALTGKAEIKFTQPVKEGSRVIAKAKVTGSEKGWTTVVVSSFVGSDLVFRGEFTMFRAPSSEKGEKHEARN